MIPTAIKNSINHSLNEQYNTQCVNTYTLSNEDVKFINIDSLFTTENNHISIFGGGLTNGNDDVITYSGDNITINEQLETLIKQSVSEFNITNKQYHLFINNINNTSINSQNFNTLPLFLFNDKKTIKNGGKLVVEYEYGIEYSDLNIRPTNNLNSIYGELLTTNGKPLKVTNETSINITINHETIKPYKKLTKINNYMHSLIVIGLGGDLYSMVSTNVISIGGVGADNNNQRIYLYGTNVLFLVEYIGHPSGGGYEGGGDGTTNILTCNITAVKLDNYDLNTADVNNPDDFIAYYHEHIIKSLAVKKYFLLDDLPIYDEKNVNISLFAPNEEYLTLIRNTDDKMVYPLNTFPTLKERKEISNITEFINNHTFNNDFYSFSSNLINQSSLYIMELLKGKDKYVKLFFTTADDLTFSVEHTNSDVEIFNKDHLIYLKNVVIPAELVNSQGLDGKTITKIECQMFNDDIYYLSEVFYYPIKEIKNLNIPITSQGVTFSYKV